MYPLLINPAPLIFTIATTFGVLIHDTQIDRASTLALSVPAALVGYAAADAASKSGDHVHVERASVGHRLGALRSSMPRVQPRDDDRRYIQTKKLYFGTGDTISLWPST